jgi:hypothetical protein
VASETNKGHTIWEHAIAQNGQYAASGSIVQGTKLIEGSGIIASFETRDEGHAAGPD